MSNNIKAVVIQSVTKHTVEDHILVIKSANEIPKGMINDHERIYKLEAEQIYDFLRKIFCTKTLEALKEQLDQ